MIELIFVLFIQLLLVSFVLLLILRALVMAYSFNSDALYVPCKTAKIRIAIEHLQIEKGHKVVDLGSGDGKVAFFIARSFPDVRVVGVEKNRFLYYWSKSKAKILGYRNIEFLNDDIREFSVEDFDRIFMYLTTDFIEQVIENVYTEMPYGSRCVSVDFNFGEGFSAKDRVTVTQYPDISAKIHQFDK